MQTTDVLDLAVDDVKTILLHGYGLVADTVEVVSGEIATVCRVTHAGRAYALKAIPVDGDEATLVQWQTSAMLRLARLGLPVPDVKYDCRGNALLKHESGGRPVLVTLTEWLTDPPLSDVPVDTDLLREVGRTAAWVSEGLDGLDDLTPPAASGHPWELVRTAASIRSALPHVTDRRTASLATHALERFEEAVAPVLQEIPWSVVHHDLHDSNLLVGTTSAGRRTITGILDFGDMVHGPRLAELAVAAAYAARNTVDPETAILDTASGWATVLPLDPREASALLPAAISRLAVNLTVWATRSNGLRAGYAAARSAGTERTLQALLDVDSANFSRRLHDRLHDQSDADTTGAS